MEVILNRAIGSLRKWASALVKYEDGAWLGLGTRKWGLVLTCKLGVRRWGVAPFSYILATDLPWYKFGCMARQTERLYPRNWTEYLQHYISNALLAYCRTHQVKRGTLEKRRPTRHCLLRSLFPACVWSHPALQHDLELCPDIHRWRWWSKRCCAESGCTCTRPRQCPRLPPQGANSGTPPLLHL